MRPKLLEYNCNRSFDIFLGRMIRCLGKEEVKRIFEMPELSQEDLKNYILEKNEMFHELYETKYQISGDLGITIEILRNLNFGKYKSQTNQKNNIEMKIFKEINKYLENPIQEKTTLLELVENVSKDLKIILREEDKKRIKDLEKRLNGKIIEEGIIKTKEKLEEAIGKHIVREQLKPVIVMIKEVIKKQFVNVNRKMYKFLNLFMYKILHKKIHVLSESNSNLSFNL